MLPLVGRLMLHNHLHFKEMLALVCVVKVRSDMSEHLQQHRVKSPLDPGVQQAMRVCIHTCGDSGQQQAEKIRVWGNCKR